MRKDILIVIPPGSSDRFSGVENTVSIQAPPEITETWVRDTKKKYGLAWIVYREGEEKISESVAMRVGRGRCYRVVVTDEDIAQDPLGALGSAQGERDSFARQIYVDSDSVWDRLIARVKAGVKEGLHIPCDFVQSVMGSLLAGGLYVIFGYMKTGKTRFILSHIVWPLAKAGIPGLFWSLEVDEDEIHELSLAPILLGRPKPATGWTETDLAEARRLHKMYPFWIGRSLPGVPYTEALRQCREECEARGARYVVVDNAGYLVRSGDGRKNLYEAEGDLSRQLKDAATDLGVPFIVITHPRKEQNGAEEKDVPPSIHDVRGNSSLVNDASGVYALHRPRVPDPENPSMTKRSPITYFYSLAGRNTEDGLNSELFFEGGSFKWREATPGEVEKNLPDTGRYGERKKVVAYRREQVDKKLREGLPFKGGAQ